MAKLRNRRSAKKMKGGSGAAEHAIATYGGMGQQHPISATDNTIAMNRVQEGGSRKRGGKLHGGFLLVDVAVPAALLATNQIVRRRLNTRVKFSRGNRQGTRKMKGG